MFQLLRGAASSDKDITQNNRTRLNKPILTNSSQIGLVGQTTDVKELLAKVFKASAKPPVQASDRTGEREYTSLRSQCQERAEQIKNLQQKKNRLRSQATIGQLQLNKWQSLVSPSSSQTESNSIDRTGIDIPTEISFTEMAELAERQKQAIATIETEIT